MLGRALRSVECDGAKPNRRELILGCAVGGIGLVAPAFTRPMAGESESAESAVLRLENSARNAGIELPVSDSGRQAADATSYAELMPRLVTLIALSSGRSSVAPMQAEAEALLASIHQAERGTGSADDAARRPPPSFESLRKEYRVLFEECVVRSQQKARVAQLVAFLGEFKNRYDDVRTTLGIADPAILPWYFIGIIHSLECGFNFKTHLHNGDYPLTKRTVHVPPNRPDVWNPPTDWESSAADALRIKGFDRETSWTLEEILYRWERFNGFGYRGRINSPYLWSFSDKYVSGKYVRDGVWDANYVSQQCGAAVLLKQLIGSGEPSPKFFQQPSEVKR